MNWLVYEGDCLSTLQTHPGNYFDSMVTDPPAGVAFMHREWDSDRGGRDQWIEWLTTVMKECYRVLKPGAHCLVWALPRTSHWTATAIDNAGFEVRDIITAHFGSGFPKSQDVRKAAIKSGIACACGCDELQSDHGLLTQDLSTMWKHLDPNDQVSGGEKQDVQPPMCRDNDKTVSSDSHKTTAGVQELQQGVPYQEQNAIDRKILQSAVLYNLEEPGPRVALAHEEYSQQLIGEKEPEERFARPKESSVEGWDNFQTGQGELSGSEVCSMPSRVIGDVPEGRLCHGAPSDNGSVDRTTVDADGNSTSHRPLSPQQLSNEPATLAEQPDTQSLGGWPVCSRCSKPVLPEGLGTALKPGSEHWILARKPLDQKTIARNVLTHRTGALNIDACRIDRATTDVPGWHKTGADGTKGYQGEDTFQIRAMTAEEIQARCGDKGRWPTNLILSHSVACQQVGVRKVKANGNVSGKEPSEKTSSVYGKFEEREAWQAHGDGDGMETVEVWECAEDCPIAEINRQSGTRPGCKTPSKAKCASIYRPDQGTYQGQGPIYGDTGGAARFFPNFHYFPKPGRKERDAGLAEMPDRTLNRVNPGGLENDPRWGPVQVKNDHPTVKSVSLMEWLIKLITPQDGVVLDPFCGSGSTGVAAVRSGFKFIGCELSADYCKIANARIREGNQ